MKMKTKRISVFPMWYKELMKMRHLEELLARIQAVLVQNWEEASADILADKLTEFQGS